MNLPADDVAMEGGGGGGGGGAKEGVCAVSLDLPICMSTSFAPPSLPPVLASRLQKELHSLATQPPPGVTCWPACESDITKLHATIAAPRGSYYEGGVFTVEVNVPLRYPFEPPKARFVTPVCVREIVDSLLSSHIFNCFSCLSLLHVLVFSPFVLLCCRNSTHVATLQLPSQH